MTCTGYGYVFFASYDRGYLVLLRCIAFVGCGFSFTISVVTLYAMHLCCMTKRPNCLFAYKSVRNWMRCASLFSIRSLHPQVEKVGRYRDKKTVSLFHLWIFVAGFIIAGVCGLPIPERDLEGHFFISSIELI